MTKTAVRTDDVRCGLDAAPVFAKFENIFQSCLWKDLGMQSSFTLTTACEVGKISNESLSRARRRKRMTTRSPVFLNELGMHPVSLFSCCFNWFYNHRF